METKVWTFNLSDGQHTVELDHGYWSGKRIIKVDGQLVEESQKLFDTGSEHRFDVNGNSCVLRIRPGTLGGLTGFEFELFVDGRLV
ncbi:hypothetical protein FM036_04365 [Nostoc sp. HG1]|nr:hypothetical protein [Nostoc sp. HG1]